MHFTVRSVIEGKHDADVMAIRWSPDGSLIAACCQDGHLRCYDAQTGGPSYSMDTMAKHKDKLPPTCIRFRPVREGRPKNVVIVGTGHGELCHWHLSSKKCLNTIKFEDTEVYAVDYRPDGDQFAVAGKDHSVHLYDEETRTETMRLQWAAPGAPEPRPAHSSRVQSIKWVPGDPNLILSAGWDRTVQIWDTRQDQSTGYFYGPYVCGDALDIHTDGRTVVTGSARDNKQIEVWDLAERSKPAEVIELPSSGAGHDPHVYSLQLRPKESNPLAAVGSTVNTSVWNIKEGKESGGSCLPAGFRSVFTLDWNKDGSLLASAGKGGRIAIAGSLADLHKEREGGTPTPRKHAH
eukprot:Hpha_TRINITY_DN12743_c0_g1::TRINITY_DN12743_c0_g1_i1::g.114362::m.114362